MAPPPKAKDSRRQNGMKKDLFGSMPFNPTTPTSSTINNDSNDPFEMGEFSSFSSISSPSQQELENAIGLLDKRILEMKVKHVKFTIIGVVASMVKRCECRFYKFFF